MKKMSTALKDPSLYKYDTSSYVVMDMKVKRDPVSGQLVKVASPKNKK